MRCVSCGTRTDPTRSFCQRCGSAVFVDDKDYLLTRMTLDAGQPQVPRTRSIPQPFSRSASPTVSQPAPVSRRARPQRSAMSPPQVAAASAGLGCVGSLVRLAVFGGLLYYALTVLGFWPDIQRAAESLLNNAQTGTATRETATPAARPAEAPRPGTVYSPGDPDVTPPRPVVRVPAEYTEAALARQIQGTVVLRAIVEPDGSVSDVVITHSIDPTYGLDAAAIDALKKWEFTPGQHAGQPARVTVAVSMPFTLRGRTNGAVPR